MTSRLLDEARAFEIIAPHLGEERRKEIAEALATRMTQAPSTPARSHAAAQQVPAHVEHDLAAADPVVKFLKSLGFAEGELTRAAGRLWSAVRADREHREVAALTETYLARLWNRITEEAKPDA